MAQADEHRGGPVPQRKPVPEGDLVPPGATASRRTFLSVSVASAAAATLVPMTAAGAAAATGAGAAGDQGGPGAPVRPQPPDAELRAMLAAVDPQRIEATVRRLVAFGTRH